MIVSVDNRNHEVQGTTASGLVSFMNRNPIQGDHGAAYASIHPSFALDVSTRQKAGICKADVEVRLRLTLTMPTANTAAMSRRTRSAWNGFLGFARRHEAHHQASYTACARDFVAAAERLRARQCLALSSDIRRMFVQMQRDCEAKQRAFDRSQARVLPGLTLFAARRAHRR